MKLHFLIPTLGGKNCQPMFFVTPGSNIRSELKKRLASEDQPFLMFA